MNWFEEWFEAGKKLLLGPEEFYREVEKGRDVGYLIKFAVTSSVIGMALLFLVRIFLSLSFTPMTIGLTLLFAVVGGLIAGTLGLLLSAAVLHVFVHLLGGEDYNRTLQVVTYPTAFQALFGWIPVVGSLAAWIYGVYAKIRGLEEFQDFSTGRAAAAVLMPVIIATVIVLISAVLMLRSLGTVPLSTLETASPLPATPRTASSAAAGFL